MRKLNPAKAAAIALVAAFLYVLTYMPQFETLRLTLSCPILHTVGIEVCPFVHQLPHAGRPQSL